MGKDGEDWHGLQTTNLKSLAKLFKPWLSPFNINNMIIKYMYLHSPYINRENCDKQYHLKKEIWEQANHGEKTKLLKKDNHTYM